MSAIDRLLPRSPALRQVLGCVAVAAAALFFSEFVLPGTGGGRGVPASVLARSIILGFVTSVSTAAIIVVYRSIRIVNFAQVALGAVGGLLAFQFIRYVPVVPFPVAVILGIVLSAALGAMFDLVFGRRFATAPRVLLTIVTIIAGFSLSAIFIGVVTRLPFFPPLASRPLSELSGASSLHDYLPLRGLRIDFHDGGIPLGFAEVFAVELAVVALAALGIFLRFTRTGVALRAAAENSERAALLGISVGGLSTLAWSISGALGAVTVICTGFVATPGAATGFSPQTLVIPLVAGVVARFRSVPLAVFATVVLVTISEAWSFAVVRDVQLVSLGLFVIVIVALLLQRKGLERVQRAEAAPWDAAEEIRPIPKEFDSIVGLRIARYSIVGILVAAILAVPFVASTGVTALGENVALGAIVAVSLVVLTGWSGQVSLGQYGLVAIGVVVGGALTARFGVPFWIAVPITVAITGAFSLLIGLPALRIKGLLLGIVTFVFSIAVSAVVFDRRYAGWILPKGAVKRPTAFFLNFNDERSMYFLCVGAFLLSVVVVLNLRRSRIGRLIIASRENESNLQSFGVGLIRTKLLAFIISGGLCGLAGIMYAHQLRAVTADQFGPQNSFIVFIYAVIGGVSSVAGVLLGTAFYAVTGYAVGRNAVLGLVIGLVPLVVIFVSPAGLISLIVGLRDALLRIIAQRRRMVVPSLFADYDAEAVARRLIPLGEPVTGAGLAAIGATRYTRRSELYKGHGLRIIDTLGPQRQTAEAALIGAAGASISDRDAEGPPS